MSEHSVVIAGLPSSGKTTFLAALWHLITARDVKFTTALKFGRLGQGDTHHLNVIAARWRDAKVQDRTATGGNRIVSMNLIDKLQRSIRVTFPDTAGEAYAKMWEDRECDQAIADTLKSGNVMLFVHSDTIQSPMWVVDEVALSKRMGVQLSDRGVVDWHPRLAPTQVQIVDLLQMLASPSFDIGPRRIAIMLSAWDKAEPEGLSPDAFLNAKLPLLAQFLRQNATYWTHRVYGVSAQGGEYDAIDAEPQPTTEAAELRKLNQPAARIRVVEEAGQTHDLTEPLVWLTGE